MTLRDPGGADPEALQAAGVDETAGGVAGRVGEHRPGVVAAGLIGPPPPHHFVDLRLALLGGAGGDGELGPQHHLGRAEVRVPVGEVERFDRALLGGTAGGEVDDPGPAQHLDGLPAVAAGVHPHRPADRAGDPGEELHAAPAGGGRLAGQHREPHAAPGHDRRPAGVGPVGRDLQFGQGPVEEDGDAGEALVGHEQVGPPADAEERHTRQQRAGHGVEVGGVAGPDQHGGGAAEPVGGERGEGDVALDPSAENGGEPGRHLVERGGRAHAAGTGFRSSAGARPPKPRPERSHSSGRDVTSPAPRVTTRSPGRVSSGSRASTSARLGR